MVDLTLTLTGLTLRLEIPNRVGMFANLTHAIATSGGNLGQIDLIEQTRQISIRDITSMPPARTR